MTTDWVLIITMTKPARFIMFPFAFPSVCTFLFVAIVTLFHIF